MEETVYKAPLTESEMQAVRALEAAKLDEGIRCKIDPGVNSGIVLRRSGAIVGFMTVDAFGGEEIESAALADNAPDWDAMAAVLTAYAAEKDAKRVLFICDPQDALVLEQLGSRGLEREFSEYRMIFDPSAFRPAPIEGVSLRAATDADRDYIAMLDEQGFGNVSSTDLSHTSIIEQNGHPAGKLRLDVASGMHGIYGVVVEETLRGQGIGAQALTLLLHSLTKERVYLEVDSENPAALHLYRKLGFRIASEFQYYPYTL